MMTTPHCSLCRGAGNARVFALHCCCCPPVVFISACGRRNQQPTKPLREEEEDLMSWLTPAFWSYQKQSQEKNWKVYRLFCILSVFSSSHRIQHRSWQLFFIVWPTYFLGVVRNHVSLGPPNHNLHTRSYRGILRMYLWYSKKKGANVGYPDTKILCRDWFCVAMTGRCWPKVPTFGCQGDMSPTWRRHSQPSGFGSPTTL
jgi:hypothetical protein